MPRNALSPDRAHPMEARIADALPSGSHWQFVPKWDGFRCLAFKKAGKVELRAKSGKTLTRYFPEVAALLAKTKPRRFILDGELVIPQGNVLSFAALQMRLHPAASRIAKLSTETPATFILFDILETDDGADLSGEPLSERRDLFVAL